MLSDRLSMDAVQMNRLCDFVNKDPPLNPLLASYFSKTIEMLLEKSPKQVFCVICLILSMIYMYKIMLLRYTIFLCQPFQERTKVLSTHTSLTKLLHN